MRQRPESAHPDFKPSDLREPRRRADDTRKIMSIPIVDERRRIVGWTDTTPELLGATLRSSDAERLLGAGVVPLYVRIEDPADVARAGAPAGWRGAWRCLALCSERMASGRNEDSLLPLVRSLRAKR